VKTGAALCYAFRMSNTQTKVIDNFVIYGLYCLCHNEGIRYVGQTVLGADKRLGDHISMVKYRIARDMPLSYLQNWIAKHGYKNICTTVLEVCLDEKELDACEERWIAALPNLTNIRPGGSSSRGWKKTEEQIEKMRGPNNPMWGKDRRELMAYARTFQGPITEETRRKMSESQKRRPPMTEETRAKLSESIKIACARPEVKQKKSKNMTGERNPMWGKKISGEHLQKIRESHESHLSHQDIRDIRRMRDEGVSGNDIAAKFSIDRSTVYHIHARRRWGWVE
jgi:group I intron endonuclease